MLDKKQMTLYRTPLVECLIYISFGLLVFFSLRGLFAVNPAIKNDSISIGIYLTLFIFIIVGLSLGFYFDYKYNALKFKSIFLYLGVAIALCNLIAVCALPNVVSLPNGATQIISTNVRLYSILFGFAIGIMPYLFFYVIPRKITHKKYIEFVLLIFILLISIFVIISFFKDSEIYIKAFKSKFSDMTTPVTSIFGHKNIFARMLMIGIFSTIIMHIYTNKLYWLLFIIPFFGVELFTFAKMPIFLTILTLLFYFIFRIIPIVKKSKENIILCVLISCFVLIIGSIFAILIVKSETGLLHSIKKMFLNFGESAKTTFHFRTIIWENTFKILKPFQYIIGYGLVPIATAIHNAYSADPRCEPDTSNIWTGHNGFVEIIAEGGIIYLLINLFFIFSVIYVCKKNYKYNKFLSIFTIGLVVISILHSITDPIMFFNEGDTLFLTAVIVWPLYSSYYFNVDKDEINYRKNMILDAKTYADVVYDNKIKELLRRRVIYDSKAINEDIVQ